VNEVKQHYRTEPRLVCIASAFFIFARWFHPRSQAIYRRPYVITTPTGTLGLLRKLVAGLGPALGIPHHRFAIHWLALPFYEIQPTEKSKSGQN
jgi:cell division protein FtsW (lipid II flippase)